MRRVLFLVVLGLAATASAIDPTTNNLMLPQSSSPQILIPAAGSVEGSGGTFFRSEINVLNYGSTDATLQFRWYPRPGEGSSVVTQVLLPAGRGMGSDDFVANILGRSGLGAILISAVNTVGVDPGARIYATSRIWTPQPGNPTGTMSQTFNVIPLSGVNSQLLALVGLRRDAQYRLNVGVVNLDTVNEQTFQIRVGGTAPTETTALTVPARSMDQINLPGAAQTGLQVHVENVTPVATRTSAWIAYGSSVDNVTGDSWSVIGFTPAP
jgi:hypothetical protein